MNKNLLTSLQDKVSEIEFIIKYLNKLELITQKGRIEKFMDFLKDKPELQFYMLSELCTNVCQKNMHNDLYIHKMTMKCCYDMRNTKKNKSSPYINYLTTREYNITANNKKNLSSFKYCIDNANDEEWKDLKKKYGSLSKYETVDISKIKEKKGPAEIRKLEITLEDKYITKEPEIKINLKSQFEEKIRKFSDIIIFYPIEFGNYIGTINFKLKFLGDNVKLQRAVLQKICYKDGEIHVEQVNPLKIKNNVATITTNIKKTNWYEAYFIDVDWNL